MIFEKAVIFSLLTCVTACVDARYILWSGTTLCVYELDARKPVATLPAAANLPQNDVFAWLEKQGVSVDGHLQVFGCWVGQAYKLVHGIVAGDLWGWRWEGQNLLLMVGHAENLDDYPDGCDYRQFEPVNIKDLTASQLREKLKELPAKAIDQIMREFVTHLTK